MDNMYSFYHVRTNKSNFQAGVKLFLCGQLQGLQCKPFNCKLTNGENNIVHFEQIYRFIQIPQEQPFNHIYIKETKPKPKFTVILQKLSQLRHGVKVNLVMKLPMSMSLLENSGEIQFLVIQHMSFLRLCKVKKNRIVDCMVYYKLLYLILIYSSKIFLVYSSYHIHSKKFSAINIVKLKSKI